MPIFPRVSLVVCRLGQPSHLHGSAPSAPSPSCPKPPQGTCCGNPGAGGGGPTGGAIGAARAAASPMGWAGGGKPPGGSNPRPGPGRDGRAESKTWGKNAIFLGKKPSNPTHSASAMWWRRHKGASSAIPVSALHDLDSNCHHLAQPRQDTTAEIVGSVSLAHFRELVAEQLCYRRWHAAPHQKPMSALQLPYVNFRRWRLSSYYLRCC